MSFLQILSASGGVIGRDVQSLPRRAKFVVDAVRSRQEILPLMELSGFSRLAVSDNPAFYEMFKAPYIHASWDSKYRIERLIKHLNMLSDLNLEILNHDGLVVAELPFDDRIYSIVVDRPRWFHREGVLAINIFKRNLRLFTIAFSFEETDAAMTCVVGGIQGRNISNALDEYRILTKFSHGMRPRDMLLSALRYFAQAKGAVRLICISDEFRHQRSSFFGPLTGRDLPMDYDAVWLDRGGHRIDGGFFEVPLDSGQRNPDEISPKKRAMYRQRYEMLDNIRDQIWVAAHNGRIEARREAD